MNNCKTLQFFKKKFKWNQYLDVNIAQTHTPIQNAMEMFWNQKI